MSQYGISERLEGHKTAWLIAGLMAVAVWGLMVYTWRGQQIAELYGYHQSLGRPFYLFGKYWYSPLTAFAWPETVVSGDAVLQISDRATLIFAAPIFVIFGLLLYSATAGPSKGRADLHGTARWATRKEIADMGYLAGKGVYVGGWWDEKQKSQLYLRHNGPEHILCFAPTRSGKGVGLILPTLLAWEGSTLVFDIKGENYALTSGFRKELHQKVLRFDPANPEDCAGFNPLEEIRLDSPRAIADVQQVATMILDPEGKGFEDYWNKAAFGFFGGVLLHCLITTKARENRTANLYDVSVMLEDPAREGDAKSLFHEIIAEKHGELLQDIFPEISEDHAEAAHIFCASAARGMIAKADKEMAGVVSSATANLSLYRDPVIAKNLSRCDWRIADLMNHDTPVNLYLIVAPGDANRLRPLLRIIMTQILGRLTEKMEFEGGTSKAGYRHRLLLMLDEFTALGKLPIIEHAIAYMAGYGVKGYFIVQNIKQLTGTYGADNALMANCHVRIAYAPNEQDTAEYLSKLTGITTVVKKNISVTYSQGNKSRSIHNTETQRPLLTADECGRLPAPVKDSQGRITTPGDMLIFTAGRSPIYGRQILYFLDPTFSARAKILAPFRTDSLYREPVGKKEAVEPVVTDTPSIKVDYDRFLQDS